MPFSLTCFVAADISCDIQVKPGAGGAGVPGLRVHAEGAVLPAGV